MSVVVTVGAQWGDEGKGKMIDYLCDEVDIVLRHQGGNNAGHTINVNGVQHIFHIIPSGLLHPEKVCVVGNGTVIDPLVMLEEIDSLRPHGISVTPDRLKVSGQAHVIMPYHKRLDALEEERSGGRLGTTKRGIGPVYQDKAARYGLRMWDLIDPVVLREKLHFSLAQKNRLITEMYGDQPLDEDEIFETYGGYADRLRPYVCDTAEFMENALAKGQRILCEGNQGTLLDVDYGTYPFVTSTTTIAGGAVTGAGIPPWRIDRILGITKAFQTRVGEGPFPTELPDETGDRLRTAGPVGEFGATTGRPRRCGWLDLVLLRYAVRVGGINALGVSKMDALGEMDRIEACVAYELPDGEKQITFDGNVNRLKDVKTKRVTFPSWQSDISGIRRFEDLPGEAKDYIGFIEQETGVSVAMISVGPEREQTICRESLFT